MNTRVFAVAVVAAMLVTPYTASAQKDKCSSCEAEAGDEALRRYQHDIERMERELATLQRQLASSENDSATVRRLAQRVQRAADQLNRARSRQAQRAAALEQRRARVGPALAAAAHGRSAAWIAQPIDGYIGVLWSASVNVESRDGEELWTFQDYPQVQAVERDSPAERAGVEAGDHILAFDGKDLRAGRIDMNAILRPGRTVALRLSRDSRTRNVSVKVEPRPSAATRVRTPGTFYFEGPGEVVVVQPPLPREAPTPAVAPVPPVPPAGVFGGLLSAATVGAEMIPLDETLGEPYGTDHGLLIVRVGPQTPAARAGIMKGDVLLTVDGRELRSTAQLIRAVERTDRKELRIELLRRRAKQTVILRWGAR